MCMSVNLKVMKSLSRTVIATRGGTIASKIFGAPGMKGKKKMEEPPLMFLLGRPRPRGAEEELLRAPKREGLLLRQPFLDLTRRRRPPVTALLGSAPGTKRDGSRRLPRPVETIVAAGKNHPRQGW